MYCCSAANSFPICWWRASTNDLAGDMAPTLTVPAEADRCCLRLEWRRGEAVRRIWLVVAGGRHVVGCLGVEQRCEVLDVPPPHSQLVLASAIRTDAALVAVVVRAEQLGQASEARRFDVDHLRRERERLDV